MKKLYLIGGTMGVGKTTACRILRDKLPDSVFLDGDWCWDMNPFQVTEETKAMVMDNICHLLNNFLHCSAYQNVIFCWVMHEQEIIRDILGRLDLSEAYWESFSLVCEEESLKERIGKDVAAGIRQPEDIARSIARIPLYEKLDTVKIDVSRITAEQAAGQIAAWNFQQRNAAPNRGNEKIRPEEEKDWREVEILTREAFWNRYRPGCSEHYILHRFRNHPDFVKELDYVLESEGRIAAHIMYSRAEILTDAGKKIPILFFGPVSVLPELQRKGYGSRLIRFTLEKAAELGIGAVAITGNPAYYRRFGFVSGNSVGIFYADLPRDEEAPFFMVKELRPGFLYGVTGSCRESEGYSADSREVDTFDSTFSPKEKRKLPCQLFD